MRTKYVEFLKKFPHIRALARASLGDVLRAWSGLGYNRRARYLHDCAKAVVNDYEGKFPIDFAKLKQLPGIGLSTAGALLSFSFGKDEPMIDTNIRRILTRVFFHTRSDKLKGQPLRTSQRVALKSDLVPRDKELYAFAKSLIPKGKGREWNYAMLDLGATLCTARNHSEKCPLLKLHGDVGDFRYKKSQKKFVGSNRFYRGQILQVLAVQRAATAAQLGKTLELPAATIQNLLYNLKCEGLITFSRRKAALPK